MDKLKHINKQLSHIMPQLYDIRSLMSGHYNITETQIEELDALLEHYISIADTLEPIECLALMRGLFSVRDNLTQYNRALGVFMAAIVVTHKYTSEDIQELFVGLI